ncbi:MAG: hypothetical protein LUD18_09610 [Lachnospiraceae bacterium]|nr:hypothetical protein [Lachnospiraceae bacterium]
MDFCIANDSISTSLKGKSGTDAFLEGLNSVLDGALEMLRCICKDADEYDEPVIMVAAIPGQPIKVVNIEEAYAILHCFGEDDVITGAPAETCVVMSYDEKDVRKIGGKRYVAGPILFYDVNDDGEEISMTAQEIYAVRLAVESRTVILTEKGRKFAAISID